MSKETKEEIVHEMRMGNTSEMPWAYIVGMPDTIEVYPGGEKVRKINIKRVTVEELAERLEKAFKREERSNAARMRDALRTLRSNIYRDENGDAHIAPDIIVEEVIDRALADPPRNCDKFATWKEASRAFEDAHRKRVGFLNLYVDVLKWLFAPAEKGCAE